MLTRSSTGCATFCIKTYSRLIILVVYFIEVVIPLSPSSWATTEADGVLWRGSYEPFGKRRTVYDPERPSYPLFFLESELAVLLSEKPPLPNADVPNVLSADELHDEPTSTTPQSSLGLGAKGRGIAEAINELSAEWHTERA